MHLCIIWYAYEYDHNIYICIEFSCGRNSNVKRKKDRPCTFVLVENDVLSRGDCPNPNINNAINGQGCMKKLNPPSRLTDGGKFCEIRTRHLCLTISMRSTKRKSNFKLNYYTSSTNVEAIFRVARRHPWSSPRRNPPVHRQLSGAWFIPGERGTKMSTVVGGGWVQYALDRFGPVPVPLPRPRATRFPRTCAEGGQIPNTHSE